MGRLLVLSFSVILSYKLGVFVCFSNVRFCSGLEEVRSFLFFFGSRFFLVIF